MRLAKKTVRTKNLFRRTAVIALALVLVVAGIASLFTLVYQREVRLALARISTSLSEVAYIIERDLETSKSALGIMRTFAESTLKKTGEEIEEQLPADLSYREDGDYFEKDPFAGQPVTANLFGVGRPTGRSPEFNRQLLVSENLIPLLRSVKNEIQAINQAYYFSMEGISVSYPYFPAANILENAIPERPLATLAEGFDLFTDIHEGHYDHPSRGNYWTEVYMDRAGTGPTATYAGPLYDDDKLVGILLTDIGLLSVSYRLRQFAAIPGRLIISTNSGLMLVDSEVANPGVDEISRTSLSLPSGLVTSFETNLGTSTTDYNRAGRYHIKTVRLLSAPWTLVHVLPRSDLTPELSLFSITVMFGAVLLLVVFYLLFFARRFSVAQKALMASEETFSQVVSALDEAIILVDPKTRFMHSVNPAAETMFGYTAEELVRMRPEETSSGINDHDADGIRQAFEMVDAEGHQLLLWHSKKKSGELFWTEVSLRKVQIAGFWWYLGVIRDVTDRVNTEQALVYGYQFENLIVDISKTFINIPTDKMADSLHESLTRIGEFINVDAATLFLYEQDTHLPSGALRWTAPGIPEGGRVMDLDDIPYVRDQLQEHGYVHITRDFFSKLSVPVQNALERDGIQSTFFADLHVEGNRLGILTFTQINRTVNWDETIVLLLRVVSEIFSNALQRRRNDNELTGYRQKLEELVVERTRELEKAQEELVQKEKLALLGQMSGMVSHELRNPLGTVRNAFYTIENALRDSELERVNRAIALAGRNIARCDRIIEELLDYTRSNPLAKTETEIDPWILELTGELVSPQDAEVDLQLNCGLSIPIDTERVRRCFENLYTNAVQAMKESKTVPHTLRVSTSVFEYGVLISIADNGPGITEDAIGKLFEPLFSTKTFGVGLGLPIVRNIVQLHRGRIRIFNQEADGAIAEIWLPADT